jgi:molybdenum cofactor cytidylyltransferase
VASELSDLELELLPNPAHGEGIAASLRIAVRWASVQRAGALILCASDQPFLTAAHLDALAAALAQGAGAVASRYADTRAIPAGFASSWFEPLLELTGDRGAAGLLRTAPDVCEVPWPPGAIDIDTADDWRRLCVGWPLQQLVESDR